MRMLGRILGLFALLAFLAPGCIQASPTVVPEAARTPTLSSPAGSLPDAQAAARTYLDAWKQWDYPTMWSLLTSVSQAALSQEEFSKHYQGVATTAALSGVDYEILSSLNGADLAQVSYRVTLHSLLAGDVSRSSVMNLSLEKGQWRVQWDDTLVLPELKGGNYLAMDRSGYSPSRGNIYDLDGHALVAQGEATAIGLYPDQLDPSQASTLFSELSSLTGMSAETIQGLYARFPQGAGWYLPLAEVPAEKVAGRFDVLSGLSGLSLSSYKSRYYVDSGVAPHILGYMGKIQAGELESYQAQGYQGDELVGQAGLEQWGEQYLAGKPGGALYVFNAQGQRVTRLAEAAAQPSQAITTTLEKDFQEGVQQALAGFTGAVVVLERDTGRVLAMASSPSFDPNAFEPVNFNSASLLNDLSSANQPLLNRATQGQYPLGSVFKTVTMAAALESGQFTADSTYMCGYLFTELPGATLHDWTYDYYQQNGGTPPSGLLTLSGGLIRSCNPWFWHIGLDLYTAGFNKTVSEMARGFGLGSATGIQGIDEAAGQIPDPQSEVDAVNMAIGQGDVLVTPLQVADFMAAVGNGGTLYRPQVIEKIAAPGGQVSWSFKPEARGKLPLSSANLETLQAALRGVVVSTKPRGTAVEVFSGLNIQVAGKTGTAQAGEGEPHAWFAGYTLQGQPDKPDIAIAVLLENQGEGSVWAAPIFRRVVELYFRGAPGKLYEWEANYNVTATPSPINTGTPSP